MCSCNSSKAGTGAAAASRPKPVTVAFPDGTKKAYDSDTAARVAAASQNGRVLVGS